MENDKKNSNINIIMKNIEIEIVKQIDGSTSIKKK